MPVAISLQPSAPVPTTVIPIRVSQTAPIRLDRDQRRERGCRIEADQLERQLEQDRQGYARREDEEWRGSTIGQVGPVAPFDGLCPGRSRHTRVPSKSAPAITRNRPLRPGVPDAMAMSRSGPPRAVASQPTRYRPGPCDRRARTSGGLVGRRDRRRQAEPGRTSPAGAPAQRRRPVRRPGPSTLRQRAGRLAAGAPDRLAGGGRLGRMGRRRGGRASPGWQLRRCRQGRRLGALDHDGRPRGVECRGDLAPFEVLAAPGAQ